MVESATRPLEWDPPRQAISRVPYLPGLDGMRALAVLAVMVYHANPAWLPGGFLGVEVFFVISGYLITLLLIGEHERTGRVDLRGFYVRRARRLLPALLALLVGITIYTTLFRRDALGQLRGDVIAALAYVSNWYQIWVGQGYTASGDFAPLRHLWSLAVEEQFYLVWPLVMIGLLRLGPPAAARAEPVPRARRGAHHGGRRPALLPGPDRDVRGHAGRLLAGRRTVHLQARRAVPVDADPRDGPAARRRVRDGVAAGGDPPQPRCATRAGCSTSPPSSASLGLGALCWFLHIVTQDGADPWLFRGGFFVTGLATLLVIAAVTHSGSRAGARARHPGAAVDRHPQLRPVPVPLADLPDHARGRRPAAVGGPVRDGARPRRR